MIEDSELQFEPYQFQVITNPDDIRQEEYVEESEYGPAYDRPAGCPMCSSFAVQWSALNESNICNACNFMWLWTDTYPYFISKEEHDEEVNLGLTDISDPIILHPAAD